MADPFVMQSVWAYVAIDPNDGDEGVIGMNTVTQGWMPFIAADKTRLDQLRPIAESIARDTRTEVRLLEFTNRVDHGVIADGSEETNV